MTQIQLAILLATAFFGAAEWPDGDEPGESQPILVYELRANFNTRARLDIPTSPIDEKVLEQWRGILNASDAQMQFIRVAYGQYVEQYNALVQALGPRLWAMASELEERALKEEPSPMQVTYRLADQLDDLCHEFRRRAIATEQAFINAIRPALTEEQLGQLRTVAHESMRRNCRSFHSTVRWWNVELRPTWLQSAAELASPQERQMVNAILEEYEAALTPLVCRCAELAIESRREYAQQFEALQNGGITHQDFMAAYERINERRLGTLQRIRQVNEQALGQIVEVVSEPTAAALTEACRRIVFPEVYPDAVALHDVFSAIVDDQHDEEARDHLLELMSSYKSQHNNVTQELKELCVEWGDKSEKNLRGFEPQKLPRALEPKFDERKELSRRYLSLMFEYLGPEAMEPYAVLIPIPLKKTFQEWIESAESNGQ